MNNQDEFRRHYRMNRRAFVGMAAVGDWDGVQLSQHRRNRLRSALFPWPNPPLARRRPVSRAARRGCGTISAISSGGVSV
jgi:hypothetical protein